MIKREMRFIIKREMRLGYDIREMRLRLRPMIKREMRLGL